MRKIKNKKTLYNNKSNDTTYSMELKKLFIIVGVILLVIAIVYLIVGIFVTKDIKWFNKNDEDVTSTIQYEEILAGETFNMNKEEYYVIFSDSTGNYYSIYQNIMSKSDKTIYIVDLNNPLNRSYVSEESNSQVQDAKDLRVKDNTMIKISNKNNVEYIEDKNTILSYFN